MVNDKFINCSEVFVMSAARQAEPPKQLLHRLLGPLEL